MDMHNLIGTISKQIIIHSPFTFILLNYILGFKSWSEKSIAFIGESTNKYVPNAKIKFLQNAVPKS